MTISSNTIKTALKVSAGIGVVSLIGYAIKQAIKNDQVKKEQERLEEIRNTKERTEYTVIVTLNDEVEPTVDIKSRKIVATKTNDNVVIINNGDTLDVDDLIKENNRLRKSCNSAIKMNYRKNDLQALVNFSTDLLTGVCISTLNNAMK